MAWRRLPWRDDVEELTPPPDPIQESTLRRALASYLIYSVIALIVVSAGAVYLSGNVARHQAQSEAERMARAVATGIVAPLTTQGLRDRDPDALDLMNRTMELRTLDGSIQHVKIWRDAGAGNGTILWSSEPPLVGKTFEMEPAQYALFGTDEVVSQVSDLDDPENEFERTSAEQLVEVYAGVPSAVPGQDILFEAYTSTAGLAGSTQSLILDIVPLPLTTLVMFMLLTLPLALSLARRVDAGQLQVRQLLVHAVDSSDHDRRRIAQELHDGVLQDIAGVGYALSSDARHADLDPQIRGHLDQASSILREDVSSLRHLMEEIYPPDIEARGLLQSIRDMVDRMGFKDVSVDIQIEDSMEPGPLTSRLAVRVTQELLRNVLKHAQASHVEIRMRQVRHTLLVEIIDDGVGFDPDQAAADGHFGLRLTRQTLANSGGELTIDSVPGEGTTATVQLPI